MELIQHYFLDLSYTPEGRKMMWKTPITIKSPRKGLLKHTDLSQSLELSGSLCPEASLPWGGLGSSLSVDSGSLKSECWR